MNTLRFDRIKLPHKSRGPFVSMQYELHVESGTIHRMDVHTTTDAIDSLRKGNNRRNALSILYRVVG